MNTPATTPTITAINAFPALFGNSATAEDPLDDPDPVELGAGDPRGPVGGDVAVAATLLALLAALAAAPGFESALTSTLSITCTTPFQVNKSPLMTFAVVFPLVTNDPLEFVAKLKDWPPADVAFAALSWGV